LNEQSAEFQRGVWAFHLFVLVFLLFVLLCLLNLIGSINLTAGLSIAVLFTLLATVVGMAHFVTGKWTALVFVILALVAGFMAGERKGTHRVPGLEEYYDMDDAVLAKQHVRYPEWVTDRHKPNLLHYNDIRVVTRDAIHQKEGQNRAALRKEMEEKGLLVQLNDREVLAAWAENLKPPGGKGPLLVVTTSGGASVSAIFTLNFLTELEARRPGASRHVRVITGASGGMLGAAYFRARRAEFDAYDKPDDPRRGALIQEMRGAMEKDFLSPVIQQMVFTDLPGLFYWDGYVRDRGWRLERAWDRHLRRAGDAPALGLTFKEMLDQERDGAEPSMIFSPMMVEDGRPLFISTLDLDPVLEQKWFSEDPLPEVTGFREPNVLRTTQSVELFKLFPKGGGLTLGTAVRLSATFPYLSPAPVLPCIPPRHVVDAGYYDNNGIDVATAWLLANRKAIKELVEKGRVTEVVVIELRPYLRLDGVKTGELSVPLTQAEFEALYPANQKIVPWPKAQVAYDELTTPLTGGGTALRSSMTFRQATQLKLVQKRFAEKGVNVSVCTFIGNLSTSLNWYLPRQQIEETQQSIRPVGRAEQKVLRDQDLLPPGFREDLTPKEHFRQAVLWNSVQFDALLDKLGAKEPAGP
jgi:hypothetical protein